MIAMKDKMNIRIARDYENDEVGIGPRIDRHYCHNS